MDTLELIDILKKGEDSQHQFKQEISGADQIASELVAFSNAQLHRLFASSRKLLADESLVHGSVLRDLDHSALSDFFLTQFGYPLEEAGIPLENIADNLRIAEFWVATTGGIYLYRF